MSTLAIPENTVYRATTNCHWLCMTCGHCYKTKKGQIVKCPRCPEKKT